MESVGFQSSLEKSDVFSKFFLEELRHCALRIVLRLDEFDFCTIVTLSEEMLQPSLFLLLSWRF